MANRQNVWTVEAVNSAIACVKRNEQRAVSSGHLIFGIIDRGYVASRLMEQTFMASILQVSVIVAKITAVPEGLGASHAFTRGAHEALALSEELSEQYPIQGGVEVHPEHLLAAVMQLNDKDTAFVMQALGIDPDLVLRQLAVPAKH